MTNYIPAKLRLRSGLLGSIAFGILSATAPVAHANTCSADKEDFKAAIQAIKSAVEDADGNVRSAFKSATSADYSDAFFESIDAINDNAEYAYDLVSEYYDISGNLGDLAQGEYQDSLPPVVTNTMENAVEMAQAALDEEKSKLDVASIRCSQDLEDTALDVALNDADIADNFYAAHKKVCKVVHVLSDLQQKREHLDELRENGYPLFHLHAKKKKDFSGKERTVQFKVDLRMYPEYPDDVMNIPGLDQPLLLGQVENIRLSYNTYFKWSDNNWGTINLYQYFMDDLTDDSFCVDLIKISNNAKAALCITDVDMNTDKETIKFKTEAQFKYNSAKKSISLATVEVAMPFGYLADVSDMKEEAMQKVKSTISEEVMGVVEEFVEASVLAEVVQDSCDL